MSRELSLMMHAYVPLYKTPDEFLVIVEVQVRDRERERKRNNFDDSYLIISALEILILRITYMIIHLFLYSSYA